VTRAPGAGAIAEGVMTAVESVPTRHHGLARPDRRTRVARQVLLPCGILAALLYVTADVFGGLRYEGYDFTSQAISELMATGAPSESFVDPLFIAYGLVVVAFGMGVLRVAAAGDRALRIAGALLIGYAVLCLTGPIFFEMRPRGTGSLDTDRAHIVLTAVLVLLTLLAIGFGAFALGKRFRAYSLATLVILLVLGAVSGPYGARLAAGEPTPGFGIIERVLVYSSVLWVAVFGVALARGGSHRTTSVARSVELPFHPYRRFT
jgi:hypothetical protein